MINLVSRKRKIFSIMLCRFSPLMITEDFFSSHSLNHKMKLFNEKLRYSIVSVFLIIFRVDIGAFTQPSFLSAVVVMFPVDNGWLKICLDLIYSFRICIGVWGSKTNSKFINIIYSQFKCFLHTISSCSITKATYQSILNTICLHNRCH